MLYRLMTDDQKRALWSLAYHLIMSDHSVSRKESDIYDALVDGLKTDVPLSPQQMMERPDLGVFDTRQSRVAALLEIMTIACGDNAFPDAESEMVHRIAKDFGIGDAEFAKIKDWAERNAAVRDEALSIIDG